MHALNETAVWKSFAVNPEVFELNHGGAETNGKDRVMKAKSSSTWLLSGSNHVTPRRCAAHAGFHILFRSTIRLLAVTKN